MKEIFFLDDKCKLEYRALIYHHHQICIHVNVFQTLYWEKQTYIFHSEKKGSKATVNKLLSLFHDRNFIFTNLKGKLSQGRILRNS